MDTGPEQVEENSTNPTYDELISVMRQQVAQTQFDNTVLQITNQKLRQRINELESELGIDDEEG